MKRRALAIQRKVYGQQGRGSQHVCIEIAIFLRAGSFSSYTPVLQLVVYRAVYSEQALIRIWAWGVGPHIILNWRRVGVAIILNGPSLFFFLWAWWGIYIP